MPPLNEKIADRLTGGGLTEARARVAELGRQYTDLYSETRKLTRQIEKLKEGGTLSEGYADRSWNDRLSLDHHWVTLSGYGNHRIIEKKDVDDYHDLMSYSHQYCPLIRAAVDIKTQYTFGQAYTITSENDANKAAIDAILNDPRNRHALFGAQAISEADKELQKGGSVYFALWQDEDPVQVRLWTSYEIADVILDPNDGDTPLYYVRTFLDASGKQKTVAYPSIYNDNPEANLNGAGFGYTVDPSIIVYQMCEGRQAKQKWALTPYTPALIWNRAFEQFLLDFAAIVQIIRKYATMFTTKGGEAQVSSLQTQFAADPESGSPDLGSSLISTEGNDFKVIDAGSNKIVGPADSRFFLLQFCASVRIPENMLCGNAQTGNRASAQELTANFLPTIEERQTMWTETFREIFTFILDDPEFEVSFPPIRTQDAQTYVATLLAAAKYMQPRDVIKAVYEACDIKIPKDAEIDALVDKIETQIAASPDESNALNSLTQATNAMNQTVQEAMKTLRKAAKT